MSEKQWMRAAVALLTLAMVAIGSRVSWVRADGIPTPTPLTYSGTLTEGGVPVNDTRFIELALWDHESDTDPSHRTRCAVPSTSVRVEQGRFQVVLPEACSAVIHDTRNLWVDIRVNGAPLGRTKIGAVPFAVEAERAADLTPNASHLLVPPGTVVAFAGDRVPAGWLLCDGTAVSQTMYPALFLAIGTAHGSGGATGMFNLPDYRGRFLRGLDGMAGRDANSATRTAANIGGNTGNTVGSIEDDATAMPNAAFGTTTSGSHTHAMSGGIQYDLTFTGLANNFAYDRRASGFGGLMSPAGDHSHVITGGDRESRPINAAVNYLIKF